MNKLATMYWERDGRVEILTLSRPQVLNAMNVQMIYDFNTAFDEIAKSDASVLVIKGEGRSFCSGLDLQELSSDRMEVADFDTRGQNAFFKLEAMDKIVIAAMQGHAIGGGLQLALACDLRIATEELICSLPAAQEAIMPGLSVMRLPRFIGLGRAKRLILTGEQLSGGQAYDLGLVDFLTPAVAFNRKVLEVVQFMSQATSFGTIQCKLSMNRSYDLPREAYLAEYYARMAACVEHPDHAEAKRALLEKRPAAWS